MIEEAKQPERWRKAAKSVVLSGELQPEDYHFRWAKDVKLIDAGCAYEYARESHKFRCWLILTDDRRKRKGSGSTFIEFKGPSGGFVWLARSGWKTWLRSFTDKLVANKSFARVLREDESKVREKLAELDSYFLSSYSLVPKAVELPGPRINYPGSQIVDVQIFWRLHTNAEIGEEMKRLADELRPAGEPGPKRRGKGKPISTESLLDALSAMRLASHLRKRDAIIRFSEIQLGKIGRACDADVAPTNFNKLIEKAKRSFALIFPFGENPANAVDFSERQRTK